ncbi:MAG: dihydroorotase [Clostridia bacterium]|nr:dihydroorotase [Clostridia bacterium]
MDYIFKNCRVYRNGKFESEDIGVCGGVFVPAVSVDNGIVIDCHDKYVLPGFADVHVHLREPGFIYKETVESGSLASAAGGYTTVCSMPNLVPAPDSLKNLAPQLEAIRNTAHINVIPYGTITKGQNGTELSDMEALAPYVAGFSDDGKGVQSEELMLAAMEKAKSLGKMIVAHCEDNSLLNGGYIHDGEYARVHGHRGICSESEWGPIKRDLELVAKTGCSYHVCHISTKESVEFIRQAKKAGLDVTCETGPHYLLLDDSDLKEEGRFKMNPPLRSKADKEALIEGIIDGTIDMIATDHAPHSAEEKGRGLEKSLMGVVGIETAFPLLYTYFVRTGIIGMNRLIELMHTAPCKRFDIGSEIEIGAPAEFTVFDLDEKYTIDPENFLSKGKSTPFEGVEVYGRCLMTVCGSHIAWERKKF